jgi:hypothetical protein
MKVSQSQLQTLFENLLPIGVALIVATVLTGLLTSEVKARLVFLRWHHALPGPRAFGVHSLRDPRIDVAALEKIHGAAFPVDPVEQNRAWYRIYKTMENDRQSAKCIATSCFCATTPASAPYFRALRRSRLVRHSLDEGWPDLPAGARPAIRVRAAGGIQLWNPDDHDRARAASR